jgi:hypothetical protein
MVVDSGISKKTGWTGSLPFSLPGFVYTGDSASRENMA